MYRVIDTFHFFFFFVVFAVDYHVQINYLGIDIFTLEYASSERILCIYFFQQYLLAVGGT